jgi:hypothetical protein
MARSRKSSMHGNDFIGETPVLERCPIAIAPKPGGERKGRLARYLGTEFIEEEHFMGHPATRKRGGDPDVKPKTSHERVDDDLERRLEEGLEESMAGSDPVNIIQPPRSKVEKQREERDRSE